MLSPAELGPHPNPPPHAGEGTESLIRLVVIIGPTAVGKTALAVQLAEKFGGEIVGADSRQVYRLMDIGTAKPTAEERARVPHHLVDIVAPDETLTLAQYKQMAMEAIADMHARGPLPFLVGGTGLYLKAVLEGWTIPEVGPNLALRQQLEAEAQTLGHAHLHKILQSADPIAAQKIDPRNTRRVIRALEVCYTTGQPISSRQRKMPPPYRTLQIGLTMPRGQLYRRIDERVDAMMAQGLLDEVKQLLALGYDESVPALSGFGYKQLIAYLRGELSLEAAVQQIKTETRRFVRRQYAWFPLDDPNILWLDAQHDAFERGCQAVDEFLKA